MKRRSVLQGLAAACALPAFAQAFDGDSDNLTVVATAFRTAAETGRPLVVFVIPDDDGEKWNRGTALGTFLNHGPDAALARLGGCELAVASFSDLQTLVPSAKDRTAIAYVVDASKIPASAVALIGTLEAEDYSRDWDGRGERDELLNKKWNATLGRLVTDALPAPADARAARARYDTIIKAPIAGAPWYHPSGCGGSFEGETNNVAMGCGMGHVAAKRGRVLYLFAVDS